MNREILFKAKIKDDGEWVEGYYQKRFDLDGSEQHFIFWSKSYTVWEYVEIDSDTLCQYTGLTDKNGRKIWENDIVECNKRKEECELYKVVWRKEYADFGVLPISNTCIGQHPIGFSYGKTLHGRDYKSVGNIFDNADLLEVE